MDLGLCFIQILNYKIGGQINANKILHSYAIYIQNMNITTINM